MSVYINIWGIKPIRNRRIICKTKHLL